MTVDTVTVNWYPRRYLPAFTLQFKPPKMKRAGGEEIGEGLTLLATPLTR